ncbi:MAG: PD-(D/E)XK nuclease family protein [Candidatus Ryanbacteria bacterium]|nr:PD-(D/E)XK nuclease family protein [Candidatus Ryanbacteria bacterium]
MRVSFSALETYNQCPQKYEYEHIERKRVPKGKESIFGTSIHSAMRFMFSRDPLFPTLEEVLAHFRESFADSQSVADADKARYLESGERMIRVYYEKNPPWNFDVIDLESRFEVPLEDPKTGITHTIAGSIDRIDKTGEGLFEIIDYKTSRKLPAQETVDANMQLAIYQLALEKKWPHIDPEHVTLALYFMKAGEKLVTRRTRQDLDNTRGQILDTIHSIEKRIETKEFPAKPNALCDWCGYKPICPAWRHLYKAQEKDAPPDDARPLIKEYFTLKHEIGEREDRLDQITASINAYLDAQKLDRVFGEGGSLARSQQERTSWDASKITSILEPTDFWQQILSPDDKKLKKLLPKLPTDLQERLLAEARIVKRFTMLKASTKNALPEEEHEA